MGDVDLKRMLVEAEARARQAEEAAEMYHAAWQDAAVYWKASRDEAREEIVYLRRQIGLCENWMDPEFGGCTPDPNKPKHLQAKE
jgi:hypothetical protein